VSEIATANLLGLSLLATLASYLAGSIPFGYLIARAVKGIDIRTLGSGNLGATNVGRTLGFRYFVLVLVLDLLKGFLPTVGFPWIVSRLSGSQPADLPVVLALAAILGHTFPVYLGFRGGKGVATSLGAVLALDPISCAVAAAAFGVFFLATRYVSLSALAGGLGFVAAHFLRDPSPLERGHIAMSVFSIAVLALLFFRHRGNIARLWAGTESRVNLRRKRAAAAAGAHPSGKAGLACLAGMVVVSAAAIGGIALHRHASRPVEASAGPWTLRETERIATGQQRIDRVAFAASGSRLAATCPRYNRLVVYQVEPPGRLTLLREIELEGRPVALATLLDRFVVLQRPAGDQRHVEPGWWETFDFEGNHIGARHLAGYYPDDLAVSPGGKSIILLSSGRAEGDPQKPLPALELVATDPAGGATRVLGRLNLDVTQDPARLALSVSGRFAAVLLAKTNHTVAIDLSIPASPSLIGTTKPSAADVPYVSYSEDDDWILMPVASQSEAVAIASPDHEQGVSSDVATTPVPSALYLACARHHDSVLELFHVRPLRSLGRLPILGPFNLGRTRPTGLAYSPERGLLAVATRTGNIHMVQLLSRARSRGADPTPIAASTAAIRRR
jgi:glycerol-3-phosphate acyltransferase PlsY